MGKFTATGVLFTFPLTAQLVLTTIAGGDFVFRGDGGPATRAQLSQIAGVGVDAAGNLLIADRETAQIERVDSRGILTVIAGNGISGFSGDGGPATRAALNFPSAVAAGPAGEIYIADTGNRLIRTVARDGTITTFAGSGREGSGGDGGPARGAQFVTPFGLAIDRAGALYIADEKAHRIRRIANGVITTFAGTGEEGFSGDGGPAARARLSRPSHLSIDPEGNLLIADWGNNRVRRVSPDGVISTIAGTGRAASTGDGGPAVAAGLIGPVAVHADARGNVYVNEFFDRVRVIGRDGVIRTFAGSEGRGFAGDGGPAVNGKLGVLSGLAGDAQGNVYIADQFNLRVRRVDAAGVISTVAGSGQYRYEGDGGPAVAAPVTKLFGVTADGEGNIYFSDTDNHRVRRIDPRGVITTYAGNGVAGFSGDGGPASEASINNPTGLAMDGDGNLYIGDLLNNRIRRVTRSGVIGTIAGGGTAVAPPDDSPARDAHINPTSLASDPDGNLFVLDTPQAVIYRISSGGRISRFAGQLFERGSTGDGGPARDAKLWLNGVEGGIALDPQGNLYIVESTGQPGTGATAGRVRVVGRDGVIRPFAGNGQFGFAGVDVDPLEAAMFNPTSIAADQFGNVVIGDFLTLWLVSRGRLYWLAGDPFATESGDGLDPRLGHFNGPSAMTFDAHNNLVFTDLVGRRLRAILVNLPSAAVTPRQLSFRASAGGAPPSPQSIDIAGSIPGLEYEISAPSNASWLRVSPAAHRAPRVVDVSVVPAGLAQGTYSATLRIVTPLADPGVHSVVVTLVVGPPAPARIVVDSDSVSFNTSRGESRQTRVVQLANAGSGSTGYALSVATTSGGNWLSVDSTGGEVAAGVPVGIQLTANLTILGPGTYRGSVTVAAPGQTIRLPVTCTVIANDRALQLSQSGLSFLAVANGGVTPPRTFEVVNLGRAAVDWSVSVSTTGGGNWLEATPARGSAAPGSAAAPSISVRVNQAGLAPGSYFGLVRVDAPGAANSPQVVAVSFDVLPETADPGPLVEPAELVFTANAGESPGSRDVFVYNIARASKTFRAAGELAGARLVALPRDQALDPARPARVAVQPFTANLAPGSYRGSVQFQFSDGRVRVVRIRLIVGPSAESRSVDGCTPSRLVPAFLSLSPSAPVTVGWPVPLTAEVRDDCGNVLDLGAVVVSFSNGDPPVSLQSLKEGRWAGTWASKVVAESATLRMEAWDLTARLAGVESLNVQVRTTQPPPVFEASGVISTAGREPFAPLAPGSAITITGERLADAAEQAAGFPLPTRLGNARVVIGGVEAPLVSVSGARIDAIVPTGITPDTRHQLLVQRGAAFARPVAVDVAGAQPALLTTAPDSRQGRIVRSSGQVASPASPATVGETVTVFASGLGVTNPAVAAGARPPDPGPPPVNAVRLTIGGADASVTSTALSATLPGVYLITARVPAGVSGDAVEVTASVLGLASPAVTMAVR